MRCVSFHTLRCFLHQKSIKLYLLALVWWLVHVILTKLTTIKEILSETIYDDANLRYNKRTKTFYSSPCLVVFPTWFEYLRQWVVKIILSRNFWWIHTFMDCAIFFSRDRQKRKSKNHVKNNSKPHSKKKWLPAEFSGHVRCQFRPPFCFHWFSLLRKSFCHAIPLSSKCTPKFQLAKSRFQQSQSAPTVWFLKKSSS